MQTEFRYARKTPQHLLLLLLSAITLAGTSTAQIWVASTGAVDERSKEIISFNGGIAELRPTGSKAVANIRYNVLPVGNLIQPISEPCCESRALMVRYRDNGSGARVTVSLKRYNVHTGQVTTLLTFDSDRPPQQSNPQLTGFQEPVPTISEGNFFNFNFAEGPTEGLYDRGGDSAYYIEAQLIRSEAGGNPGLASVRIVTVKAP
jgi:hypothetical protein